MNLDIFDKLKDATKDENKTQSFLEDMSEFLERKFSSNNLDEAKRKEITLLQEIQQQGKVTTAYRDKMLVERSNILNNYAKETFSEGPMYFVYSKSKAPGNKYNLCICEEEMSHKVISVEESKLPGKAGVDSVLRLSNGEYILDEKATEYVLSEMNKMIQKLLEEQALELRKKRIEGCTYEIVEISGNSAWIMNKTQNDGECFEEIGISKEVLDSISCGDLIQYVDGAYIDRR